MSCIKIDRIAKFCTACCLHTAQKMVVNFEMTENI